MRLPIITFLLLVLAVNPLNARDYVNTVWTSTIGSPLNLEWTSSIVTSSNKVLTVGNTTTSSEGANMLITLYHTNGSVQWQQQYNGPNDLDDYAIAVAEDAGGDFLVTGASTTSSNTGYDITIIKVDPAGNVIWDYTFNGSASGDDVPSRVISDASGNVIVCGVTESTGTAHDFVTILLNTQGVHQWTQLYDHNSLDDGAVGLHLNPNTGEINVSGGSANQIGQYDMAVVSYDVLGNQVHEHRSNYGVGISQPSSFAFDTSGNIIIGGWYVDNTMEMHMALISLNDTLGLNWDVLTDLHPGEDKIMDLAVTQAGDIFACGHTTSPANEAMAFVARFNSSGTMVWNDLYASHNGESFARRMSIDSDGNLNIAGMVYRDTTDTNILLLRYTQDGMVLSAQEQDAGGAEVASNLELDNWGNIYIHGTTTSSGNGYVTTKYSTFTRPHYVLTDTVDTFDYVNGEIILQFYPEYVDSNAVNDRGKTFGQLSDFVKQAAIDELNAGFEAQYDFGRMSTVKVFRLLGTDNAYSITRLGDTIAMPPFWSTFVVLTPENMEILSAATYIDTQLVETIMYAEVNSILEPDDSPDDSLYLAGNQEGLESANTPENDINMDRAWDFQHGSPAVKVGIVDAGIQWAHEDLNITGAITDDFDDSKVAFGYDFYNHTFVSSNLNNDESALAHGSKCAGVIGAIRNNAIGVAGIAGGDASTGNYGVRLVDLKVGAYLDLDARLEALVEGARNEPNADPPGYGCHVINLSASSRKEAKGEETAVRFVYNNDCVFAASSGNRGKEKPRYPSSYNDRMILKIGASNEDGERWTDSNYGHDLDVIAPGVNSLVHSLFSISDDYSEFGKTSAATPHGAGVASLLISQVKSNWNPNGLAPEDVERLIELHRTDLYTQGYDAESGHGRINAGWLMEEYEWPFWWVEHHGGSTTNYTSNLVFNDVKVKLLRGHDGIKKGSYKCDVYSIVFNVSHNIGSAGLEGAWMRNGSSVSNMYGLDGDLELKPEADASMFNPSVSGVQIKGYVYHVKKKWFSLNNIDQWIPFQLNDPAMYAYSLYLHDPEATGTDDVEAQTGSVEVSIYPNPADGVQTIVIHGSGKVMVDLYDITGRWITKVYEGMARSELQIPSDLSTLEAGIYLYRVRINDQQSSLRVLKTD